MADLPTATDFFGAQASPQAPAPPASSLPSARDFFGMSDQMVGHYSGPAPDTIWSSAYDAGARILNNIGYGATSGWGKDTMALSQENVSALKKAGFDDKTVGAADFALATSEAIFRPSVAAQLFKKAGLAALGGFSEGGIQTGTELVGAAKNLQNVPVIGGALAAPVGELGEGLQAVSAGQYFDEYPRAHIVDETARARALGVIGEGEKGFHDIPPEGGPPGGSAEARAAAAKEAGLPPPQPVPPPDIHTLARQIDPETFQKYDALAVQRQQYGAELERLTDEHESSPEVTAAHEEVESILDKVNGVEDRLTGAAKERLTVAEYNLDQALRNTDSAEMREAQFNYTNLGQQMQPLYGRVQSAYRRAQEMLPEPEPQAAAVPAKAAEEAPKPGSENEAEQAQAIPSAVQHGLEEPHMAPPQIVQASESEAPQIAPQEVTGDQKLGEATQPKPRYGAVKPIEGTGETKARGVSQGIEAKAIEQGLTTSFGDLPEYQRVSMADQAQKALSYIDKDYESAKAVAMGQKAPPKGILPESLLVAVEKRALAEGDVDTLRNLATQSSLSGQITTMGQRIRTLAERDPASPVGAIAEVQRAREEAFKAREKTDIPTAKAQAVAEAKTEIRKGAQSASKQSWAEFINSIKCGE